VREVDDATAYMMLATCNAQSELTALERGLHVTTPHWWGKSRRGLSINGKLPRCSLR
jgi:hypothetical protein